MRKRVFRLACDIVHITADAVPKEALNEQQNGVPHNGVNAEALVQEEGLLEQTVPVKELESLRRWQTKGEKTAEIEMLSMRGRRRRNVKDIDIIEDNLTVVKRTPAVREVVFDFQKNAISTNHQWSLEGAHINKRK